MPRKATIPDEEPQTMARVEGLIKEIWPTCFAHLAWVEGPRPIRHVVVRFRRRDEQPRCSFEGAGATWREAFIEIEKQRQEGK